LRKLYFFQRSAKFILLARRLSGGPAPPVEDAATRCPVKLRANLTSSAESGLYFHNSISPRRAGLRLVKASLRLAYEKVSQEKHFTISKKYIFSYLEEI